MLTDGIAGHDRASDGIVAALARHRTVNATWLGIREVPPRSRRIARVHAALGAPDGWLSRGVRLDSANVAPAWREKAIATWPTHTDIVVSTGPSTAAANIAAGRRYGARTIYFGFPKWPVIGFSLILCPVPSPARCVALTPRPVDLDASVLPRPRPLAQEGPRQIALLFGGESKHYAYRPHDMAALGTACRALLAARPNWSLDAYDSRRTATALFEAFVAALAPLPERVRVHRFKDEGLGSNRSAFSADLLMVSADSLSMINEAVAAARPTLIVRADSYRGPRRDRGEIAALARAGLVGQSAFGRLDLAALLATPVPPVLSRPEALSRLLRSRGF